MLFAVLVAAAVPATGIESSEIRRDGDRYLVRVASVINAPATRIRGLLTDYPHFHRIHPTIQESRWLKKHPDGRDRVYILSRICVLIFCFDIDQITDFQLRPEGDLQGNIVPAGSDFHYGRLYWRIRESKRGTTHIMFSAEVEPSQWIPPLIGPWILKKKLHELAVGTVINLERLARQASG